MVQSNYDTANQVVGVFRAEIKALPVKLSISTSTSLMEDFLDACQEFDFLTVPKVSEGPDKRFLDQCLFRSFIYFVYSQQVENSDRGFIKKVFGDIESLTGRRFDLMQKYLVLKVHLWALGKTKCLPSCGAAQLSHSGYAVGEHLCMLKTQIWCVHLSGLEDKAGQGPSRQSRQQGLCPKGAAVLV